MDPLLPDGLVPPVAGLTDHGHPEDPSSLPIFRLPTGSRFSMRCTGSWKVRGIELKVLFGAEGYARRKFRFQAEQCQFPTCFLGFLLGGVWRFRKTMFSYGGIMKAIRAEQADRVVVSGFHSATMRLWWRSQVDPTGVYHLVRCHRASGSKRLVLRRLQRRLVVSRASGFLAYGTLAKDYLIGLGARPDRVGLAFNTVDTTFFSEETEGLRKSLTAGPPFHLTYVGYLSPGRMWSGSWKWSKAQRIAY